MKKKSLFSLILLSIFSQSCKTTHSHKEISLSELEAYNNAQLNGINYCGRKKAFDNVWIGQASGTLDGNNFLVLINKEKCNKLKSNWEPSDLVEVTKYKNQNKNGGNWHFYMRREAYRNLIHMLDRINRDVPESQQLKIYSGYRPFAYQCFTFLGKVQSYRDVNKAAAVSAIAGTSQHQLGTTVDLAIGDATNLNEDVADSPQIKWMLDNAYKYGYILSYPEGREDDTGYVYEPWHWRYIGLEAAKEAYDNELILDEYLKRCRQGDSSLKCVGRKDEDRLSYNQCMSGVQTPEPPPVVVNPSQEPASKCRSEFKGACMTVEKCEAIRKGQLQNQGEYQYFNKLYNKGSLVTVRSSLCPGASNIKCCTAN